MIDIDNCGALIPKPQGTNVEGPSSNPTPREFCRPNACGPRVVNFLDWRIMHGWSNAQCVVIMNGHQNDTSYTALDYVLNIKTSLYKYLVDTNKKTYMLT